MSPDTKPLSAADAREGECTRCNSTGQVWPLEQPADIVMELKWGYAWLCLDCWRQMEDFVGSSSEADSERTPQEEWEEHNEQFQYEPPEKPGDAWSSEEYQELHDRVIRRRTNWLCDKCTGHGPFGSLQKARRHVQSHHGQDLIEQYETPRDELETATDGGTDQSDANRRKSENYGLGEFSGGDAR